MALTAGIVGLPNIGKSTLYNAVTRAGALVANYPFATIEPNVGTVFVPDDRLESIADATGTGKKTIPTTFEFIDIAGLVKGASKGEGLGNQFLSHIRSVDAIVHVVRCFEDDNITHVDGHIDPLRDIDTIETELVYADFELILKRLPKIEKKAVLKVDPEITKEYEILKQAHEALLENRPIRSLHLNKNEIDRINHYGFLTLKPVLYALNIAEDDMLNPTACDHVKKTCQSLDERQEEYVIISAQIESELAELDQEEHDDYLETLGLETSGLDRIIKKSYALLNLETFFTTNEKEVRAWTFKTGSTAPECAGRVHSDFERGFIRAETVHFDDLMAAGTMQAAKETGKVRSEGRHYQVKDGDIILFRFNV